MKRLAIPLLVVQFLSSAAAAQQSEKGALRSEVTQPKQQIERGTTRRVRRLAPLVSHFDGNCNQTIAFNACYVKPDNYDPNKYGKDYKPPACGDAATTDQKNKLDAAMQLASRTEAYAKLCRLKQIFITKGDSWGLWEAPGTDMDTKKGSQPPGKYAYIAVSEKAFGDTTLSDDDVGKGEENAILRNLLPKLNDWTRLDPMGGKPPRYTEEQPREAARPIFAILAHELGHVLFYESAVDDKTKARASTCFDTAFIDSFWDPSTYGHRRWVSFKKSNSKHKKKKIKDVDAINALIEPASLLDASDKIRDV